MMISGQRLLLVLCALSAVDLIAASERSRSSNRTVRVGKMPVSRQVTKLARSASMATGGLTDGQRRGFTSLSDVQYTGASGTIGMEHAAKHLLAGVKGASRSVVKAHRARLDGKHGEAAWHSVCAVTKPVAALAAAGTSAAVGFATAAGFGIKAVGDLAAIPYDAIRHRNDSEDTHKRNMHHALNLESVIKYDKGPEKVLRTIKSANNKVADFVRGPSPKPRSMNRSQSMPTPSQQR